MVFSSVSFLVFFLPSLLLTYFLVPRRFRGARNGVLLAFSLVFYACGGVRYLALLLLSIVINYLCGLLASDAHSAGTRKLAVVLACVLGPGLLGWFKYSGFFAEIVNALGVPIPIPHVVLPIGISFFTFQGLSYVIDVARGDVACQRNPFSVALYVALFPQLVAGPIVRYTTVEHEITERTESLEEFSAGLVRFCFGFAKKMLLANAIGELADSIYAVPPDQLSTAAAWLAAVAYSFQIYFDFSAYSDMAIGLGRMFGFHFPENFNYSFTADSVADFWRRQHISLSLWFRDYVYIPLGGSRRGPAIQIRNLVIVWVLTGLWHGAAWNFIVWGIWFCLFLIGENFLWKKPLRSAPAFLRHIYALLVIAVSMVFFRGPTLSEALRILRAMFSLRPACGPETYFVLEYWPELILCTLASLPIRDAVRTRLERHGGRVCETLLLAGPKVLALALLGLSYMKLVSGSFNPFIYFHF